MSNEQSYLGTSNDGMRQFIRKASLVVLQTYPGDALTLSAAAGSTVYDEAGVAHLLALDVSGTQGDGKTQKAIDLSAMHFTFTVSNQDEQAPDNCVVRVFNLKRETVQLLIKNKTSQLILQAGYEGSYGIIFQGDIKQYRVGRANETDTYIDILAADGDLAYNRSTMAVTLAAIENTRQGPLKAINDSTKKNGVVVDPELLKKGEQVASLTGGVYNFRGKTMVGMARAHMTTLSNTLGATWSISDGVITMVPLAGYLPGEAVHLNQGTGLIGTPEQTQDGIVCQCLINPKIQIGGRVQINNALINQTISGIKTVINGAQVRFNSLGFQNEFYANVTHDGLYRVYVCEHVGDSRGQQWYSNLTLLAIDSTTDNVIYDGGDGQ